MSQNFRYVVKNDQGGWAVKKPGAERASSLHDTQREAEQRAKEIINKLGGGEIRIQTFVLDRRSRIVASEEISQQRQASRLTPSRRTSSPLYRRFYRVAKLLSNPDISISGKINIPYRVISSGKEAILSLDLTSQTGMLQSAKISIPGVLESGEMYEVEKPVTQDTLIDTATKAFRRELPSLLETHSEEWVAFHGAQKLGIAKDKTDLYKEITERKIPFSEILIERIQPESEEIHLRW